MGDLSESMAANLNARERIPEQQVREFLATVKRSFETKTFRPHQFLAGGHAQTLAAYAWPRRFRYQSVSDPERLFQTAPDTRVLAHCRWQSIPVDHPTLVMWHGIEGSTSSAYMPSTAEKAFGAGFNVVRVNVRNCGDTEHLTPTLYHGGLTDDLRAVVKELIDRDDLRQIFLAGFSLGGNMVLKCGAEYSDDPPPEVLGVCAISPSVDLAASAAAITQRGNQIYQRNFVGRLLGRIRRKQKLFPERYDLSEIHLVRTLREFDDRYVAPAHGFAGADDYYYRASSIRVVDRVRIPTLIIHARDDPFIPFAPLRQSAFSENPYILLVAPDRGGHVAFVSEKNNLEDRFWAENRLVEFCLAASKAFAS